MNRLALLLLLAGCSSGAAPWSQSMVDLPYHAEEVVKAVAALPECDAVRQGGIIHWRDSTLTCGGVQGVSGCAHPFQNPPLVEVVMRGDAWDGPPSKVDPKVTISSLAHELCHVCGYTDGPDAEAQADSCAMRARLMAGR